VSHQSNLVEVQEYLLKEGNAVDIGMPIAIIENYWAKLRLKDNSKGFLQKTFFGAGTSVKIGDPIAIIGADGEDLPYGRDAAIVEIEEIKRRSPNSHRRRPTGVQ
jgi:pyruvate/2-oxoglutarate dehydrogenase complex dihydrolipoamide acyltransferase (E2) component